MCRIFPADWSSTSAPSESSIGTFGVDRVQLVEVDAVDAEPAEAASHAGPEVLGSAISVPAAGPCLVSPPFVAMTMSFGYGCSASATSASLDSRAVRVGGVEESPRQARGRVGAVDAPRRVARWRPRHPARAGTSSPGRASHRQIAPEGDVLRGRAMPTGIPCRAARAAVAAAARSGQRSRRASTRRRPGAAG